jgi:hypothetical protein
LLGVFAGKLSFLGIKLGCVELGGFDLGSGFFQDTCFTGSGITLVIGSVGVGIVWGVVTLEKISASWWSACRWLSANGASGDAVAGASNALIKSWAAAVAASIVDAPGIVTNFGSQVRVSAILSEEVSCIHTL